jgi:hypothetical protein
MIVRQENALDSGQGKERIVNERNKGEEKRKYDNKRGYESYKAERRTVRGKHTVFSWSKRLVPWLVSGSADWSSFAWKTIDSTL